MIWVLAFTMLIGQTRNHVTVEPFSTLYLCQVAAERVAAIPKADAPKCTLKEQRPA